MQFTPLQFVVGKGGVGKSTLSAALAIAAARAGRRVLALEVEGVGGLARTFKAAPSRPGVPIGVRPGIEIAYIEGESALAEYLELIVPIRRLLAAVFASRIYRYFVAAAPGLKELMTVGKVWYEHQRLLANGEHAWEVIVVDAGASGHSLQYLQMPRAAATTFRSGLVHREAVTIQKLLSDPAATAIHVVATPEEMPLTEARQIIERLRGDLDLPLGRVFVNRCRRRAPEGARSALTKLAAMPLETSGLSPTIDGSALRDGMRFACSRALGWESIQEDGVARLEAGTGLSVIRLPLLASEEFGLREVELLADVVARHLSETGQ